MQKQGLNRLSLLAADPRVRLCNRARKMPLKKKPRTGRLPSKQRTPSSLLHACQPLDNKPNRKYKVYKHLRIFSPRRDLRRGRGGRAAKRTSSSTKPPLKICVIYFDTIPKEYIKKGHPHQGQGRNLRQVCGAVARSVEKDASNSAV